MPPEIIDKATAFLRIAAMLVDAYKSYAAEAVKATPLPLDDNVRPTVDDAMMLSALGICVEE